MNGLSEGPPIVEWVAKYEPQLLALARTFETEYMSAEDIVQVTWVVAIRKGGSLPPGSRPGAWLYQVVMNLGRAAKRKEDRRRALSSLWEGWKDTATGPSVTIPEQLIRQRMWQEISALPQAQQEVLLLKIVDEYEPTEIADMLRSTPGAVRAKLARALRTMRERMAQIHPDMAPWPAATETLAREGTVA